MDSRNQITIFHEGEQLIAIIDSESIKNMVNSSTSIAKIYLSHNCIQQIVDLDGNY